MRKKKNTIRKRVYCLLNPEDDRDRFSDAVNIFIITLILINVFSASLETIQGLYETYRSRFFLIEMFSVIVFTLEYLLRLWCAAENKKYKSLHRFIFSFDAIVDLLAILPFYVGIIFGVDLRALVALRLLRLLKLIRYFEPLAILGAVMKAEFRAFMAAMFVLVILIFVAATGIYFFECKSQPDVFGSIPESMWWAVVTLTTLGYGDVIPITAPGRLFAALITIFSIGTVALPAGMLASRFSEELRKRKNLMSEQIAALAADGNLSTQDYEKLEEYRVRLCLSDDDMQKLLVRQQKYEGVCPLCGNGGNHEK